MDHQKDFLKLCKPLYIKVTRLTNSDINTWKQRVKHMERPHSRRRILSAWQRGDCRDSKSLKIQRIKKKSVRIISSDTEDESSNIQTFDDNNRNTTLNESKVIDEADTAVQKTQTQVINNSALLPKNKMPINDKIACKFKWKRKRTSSLTNEIVQDDKNIEVSNTSQPNTLNNSDVHEAPLVNLNKQVKIVSSRLEDSDDPQVERWRSKKKVSIPPKSKSRLPPKSNSLNCTVCSVVFENKEQLSNHIFKHTQRELQNAYKAAKTRLRGSDFNGDIARDSDEIDDCDATPDKLNQLTITELTARNGLSEITPPVSSSMNTLTKVSHSVSMDICSCHNEYHQQNDASVQIEMVLFCETCCVLFRRSECFETHYRSSSKCNADRTKGRTPKLFCSTCRVVLNTLSYMRRHLQEHASINFHGTVTFVCNICRVVFFGVGTVFCTHWLNHEKEPTFVASRYSFPKLCVSTQGTKPSGSLPDEQYLFVAEYVCRSCKMQFSSDCELANHIEKDCNGISLHIQTQQKSLANSKSITNNSKLSKSKFVTIQPKIDLLSAKIDSIPPKPLDYINKWICEFCNECYPSRSAFEEHSSKHLQDDGYPGYSCAFQLNSSTAFVCNVCRSVYNSLEELIKHWVTHEVIKFICSVCNEKSPCYNSLEEHISLGCWKSKPDCRVWFNRQQHVCKICKSTYKTAKELAHHYTFNHVVETDDNTSKILSSHPLTIMETPPASETSASPRSKENDSNQVMIANTVQNIDIQSAPMDLDVPSHIQNSTVTTTDLDIENSVNNKSPLQELSTIKITIPNVINQSVNSRQDHDDCESIPFRENSQHEVSSDICELTSTSTAIDLSNGKNTESLDLPSVEETANSQHLSSNNTTIKITMRDTCLHGSTLITANIDENAERQINFENIPLIQSAATTGVNLEPPNTTNSLSNNSILVNVSESSNGSDTIQIIEKPETIKQVDKTANKITTMNENDEPDIIEITNNPTILQNQIVYQSESTSLVNSELNSLKSTCGNSPSVHRLYQETTSNSENVRPSIIKSVSKFGESSAISDMSKPQGFLRVKKFTELQAVRNYICSQCAAAFDNVKSLNEHMVAHDRRSNGNEKQPTMMAALILPQVDLNQEQQGPNIPISLPCIPPLAGKRMLPCIPQRVTSADARKASPLVRGQPSHKSHTIPTTQNVPNVQNVLNAVPQSSLPCYTCRLCLSSRFESAEALSNHLSTHHNSSNVLNTNSILNSSNLLHSGFNAASKEKQRKIFTCKICKHSAFDRETMVEHVQLYHLNEFQTIVHNVPRNDSSSVQPTTCVNNSTNSNVAPSYKCHLCPNYSYSSLEELAQHYQTIHQCIVRKEVYRPYVCNLCFALFHTYDELIVHLNNNHNAAWT